MAWVAGPDGPRLVCCERTSRNRPQLTAYDLHATGVRWAKAWGVAMGSDPALVGRPDLPVFVAVGKQGMELRDALKGAVVEALCVGELRRPDAPALLADGALVAAWWGKDDNRVLRWDAGKARSSPRRPAWGWPGGAARRPDTEQAARGPVSAIIEAPDGEIATLEGKDIVARDAATLEERAVFRPSRASLHGSLAFTTDGRLLVGSMDGLAVWPWRELMGRP